MALQNQHKLKVKVNNNEDIRLWRNAAAHDFEGLCSFISSTWHNTDFIAQYEDDEGDLLTIASAQDLKDAFDFARQEKKKSLKIFIQNYVKQKREKRSQPTNNNNNEPQPPAQEAEEKQEPKQFDSVREMVFDFLSNQQILTLLPEMFASLITKLVEKGSNLNEDEIILLINQEITNNEQFAVISSHPLYAKYAQLAIPFFANKIAAQQSLYKHFNLATIKTWIRQLLQMLAQAMQQMSGKDCAFKDVVIDIEYPAMTDTGKVIHFGVECDLCGEYPIIGDRYKCTICEDWDCCPGCEPKHDHPLIKFKKSSKNHQNASFKGLAEIIQRLSGECAQRQEQKEQEVAPENKEEEVEDNEVENIDIYDDDVVVDCICGSKMECVMAKKAYSQSSTIYCDVCGVSLFDEMVYHCPKNKDPVHHENGYDVCPKCADKKAFGDKEQEENDEQEEKPKKEEAAEAEPEEEEEEEFEFAFQLVQIKQILRFSSEMDPVIKQMLVEHKGDIAKVVPLLLQDN